MRVFHSFCVQKRLKNNFENNPDFTFHFNLIETRNFIKNFRLYVKCIQLCMACGSIHIFLVFKYLSSAKIMKSIFSVVLRSDGIMVHDGCLRFTGSVCCAS